MVWLGKLALIVLLTVCVNNGTGSKSVSETCNNSRVEVTWLGVTMYFVRYWYLGKEIKLLLDDQISKDYIAEAFDDVLGANGKLDYIFIGHMHFDHDGECPQRIYGEPWSFECAPFQDQAAKYSAKVVAPSYGCQMSKPETECLLMYPNSTSPQVFELPDIGLRVTAIPNAHTYLADIPGHGTRGAPGCKGGITGLSCPDPFAYLLEFPGERGQETDCASSMFWADTAHNREPFLEGHSEIGDPSLPPLNYSQLLRQAFSKRSGNVRSTFMAFPSHFLPNEEAWQEWAQIVRPLYHTSHHHGENPDDLWPKLRSKLQGSPLGEENATWLPSAVVPATSGSMPVYPPSFLPLVDFFETFRFQGPLSVKKVDLGYAAKFRSHNVATQNGQFSARVSLQPLPASSNSVFV